MNEIKLSYNIARSTNVYNVHKRSEVGQSKPGLVGAWWKGVVSVCGVGGGVPCRWHLTLVRPPHVLVNPDKCSRASPDSAALQHLFYYLTQGRV